MNTNTSQRRSTPRATRRSPSQEINLATQHITSATEDLQHTTRTNQSIDDVYLQQYGQAFIGISHELDQDSGDLESTCTRTSSLQTQVEAPSQRACSDDSLIAMYPTYCEDLFERKSKVETLANLVRECCWDTNIRDDVSSRKFNYLNKGTEEASLFKLAQRVQFGQNSFTEFNIPLRCYLMVAMYKLLHQKIFAFHSWRGGKTKKYALKAIVNLMAPFFEKRRKFHACKKQLSAIVDRALYLREMLEYDDTGKYTMVYPDLKSSEGCMSVLGDSVRVMAVIGAQHRDPSRDVARFTMFGGLQRMSMEPRERGRVLETKPWVVVDRPRMLLD